LPTAIDSNSPEEPKMSRRKKQSPASEKHAATGKKPRGGAAETAAALHGRHVPRPARPRPWFLAVTMLLQGAWIVFLLVLACSGN